MAAFLSVVAAAALISSSWAAAAPAAETSTMVGTIDPTPSGVHHQIRRSHVFNVESRAVIDSVLSDVRRRPLARADGSHVVLDVDASSTRLGDDGAVSLLGELMPLLKSKAEEGGYSRREERVPVLVKLVLAMNKLTPKGASGVLDLLAKKDDEGDDGGVLEEVANGTIPAESGAEDGEGEGGVEKEPDSLPDGLNNETAPTVDAPPLAHEDATTPAADVEEPAILFEELDLSFNDIGSQPNVQLLDSVRRMFEGDGAFVPRILTLENCCIGPAFCRSIGRGILNAFEGKNSIGKHLGHGPSVLRIGGNAAVGDAGTVALAAALRMAVENDSGRHRVLEELDLSSCDVGDAGAEALALALASNPGCLGRLDLSNNKINDAGAKALGRALVDAAALASSTVCEQIILDNNKHIGDDGAAALAEAFACDAVRSVSVRSCSVKARGTAAFGKAVLSLANRKRRDGTANDFRVDLSGNHFGTEKVKKKKGVSGAIRDRASTNIKFIGKTLKGAAKRFSSDAMGITADSDDDEEVMGGLIDEIDDAEDMDDGKIQACGGHSFAGAILQGDQKLTSQKTEGFPRVKVTVGMRQCMLGDRAVDALCASVIGQKNENCDMSVDVSMNSSVDDEVVKALMDGKTNPELVASMAERHMDYLDRMADSRQRQLEAGRTGDLDLGGSFFDDDDEFYDDYD